MSIILPVNNDDPLSQGDVIKGPKIIKWSVDGPEEIDVTAVVVVSRDCRCVLRQGSGSNDNNNSIIVAPIQEIQDLTVGLKKLIADSDDGFDKTAELLRDLRDGLSTPDSFYIGELPNERRTTKYRVHLGLVANIYISTMISYLPDGRVGRLSQEFIALMCQKMYGSICKVGFDDYRWHSDNDLLILHLAAKTDLANLIQTEVSKQRDLENTRANPKTPDKEITKKEEAVEDVRRKLARCRDIISEIQGIAWSRGLPGFT